jgi:hypothetical protein
MKRLKFQQNIKFNFSFIILELLLTKLTFLTIFRLKIFPNHPKAYGFNHEGETMKKQIVFLVLLCGALMVKAENYLINGGQESQINYQMEQRVAPAPGTQKLILSYVVPATFTSPTFTQKITQFRIDFSQNPSSREEDVDKRGNKIVRVTWNRPSGFISSKISLSALNSTGLKPLKTNAPFPLTGIPMDAQMYLASTNQVPATNPEIIAKARQLTASAKTEFAAVQQINSWVVDKMQYVLAPESYEALYSFRTGKGNCQNYSHLAAVLMRAAGIPARIVNGVTLKQPYDVDVGDGILTLRMAQGRHSWIEVWFPDLGWVPFDPQQTQLFVSNRFIRVEIGLDNEETSNDGLIRWTQSSSSSAQPQFEEAIEAAFVGDRVQLNAQKQNYGPKKLLFSPTVDVASAQIAVAPAIVPPTTPSSSQQNNVGKAIQPSPITPHRYGAAEYNKPFLFGNLEFPRNVDFLSARGPAQQRADGQMEMRKNFMVETAEYITTQGNQYAQTFILAKPIKLNKVGLALHKFGGDGQLWVEILRDDGKGKPSEYLVTSELISLAQLKFSPGYDWVDFDFSKEPLTLPAGRYWIALGFTGSPIINWFFSYGKPVGPEDGTKYKTMFDEAWSRSLSYEFNYRVVGLAVE